MPRLLLLLFALPALAVEVPFPDGDCEGAEPGAWQVYGTPTVLAKVPQPHQGQRALRVVTDNQQVMYRYEGTSHGLRRLELGDRVRLRLWLRPTAGKAVLVAIGRTSFEAVWRFTDSDWFEAVCDFRCTVAGDHNVWISQDGEATEFLIDDARLDKSTRLQLGAVPEAERVKLQSAGLRAWFDRRNGALCGLENLLTGETVAKVGEGQPVFALERLAADGHSLEPLGFDRAKLTKLTTNTPGKLTAAYTFAERIDVECRWEVRQSELRGVIAVTNHAAQPILSVTFPLVQDVAPATDPEQLVLVDPDQCARIVPHAIHSSCEVGFPGRGVMGWLDLSGEKGGVALICEDKTWTGTRLTALPAGASSFDLSLSPEVVIGAEQTWTSAPMALFLHAGDWHASADRYRTWLTAWQPAPDVPEWLRHCNGWVLTGCQNNIPFHRLPDIFRQTEWMGCDYLHVQGEHIDGLWLGADGKPGPGGYALPIPNPHLGGEPAMRTAVQRIHERGGHVMFYFLYDRWCPELSTAERLGGGTRAELGGAFRIPAPGFYPQNALMERPGERLPTEHDVAMQRMMCLAGDGWRDWMHYWGVDVYAQRIGADGMYWDVMGRNGPFRCYNPAHHHDGRDEWGKGCAQLMESLIRDGRKITPSYSSAIEGCSAALRPWVGFHLMSGATQQPEVVRYTLPDLLLVDGFSNHTWKWTQPEKARRVFLAGERFDLHGYDARIKPMVQLREQMREFTDWPARFLDTVGVSVSDPKVQARGFLRADGENRALAVTLMNEEAIEGATVTIHIRPLLRAAACWVLGLDGRITRATPDLPERGIVRLAVPKDPIAGILIVDNVAPELAVIPTVRQIMEPGVDGVEVTLLPPGGKLPEAQVTLTGPDGQAWLELVDTEARSTGLKRLRFSRPDGIAALTDWTRVTANVSWAGGKAAAWCIAAPPLINGDMETLDDGWLRGWGTAADTAEKHGGLNSLRMDNADGGFMCLTNLTPIKPLTRYRMSAWIRRHVAGAYVSVAMVEYEEGTKLTVPLDLGAGGKQDVWEQFTGEFTSGANPRSSAVYLYCRNGTGQAWFDDITLEELPQ